MGIATADLFPRFSLTKMLGLAATGAADLFTGEAASARWVLDFRLPALDGGGRQPGVRGGGTPPGVGGVEGRGSCPPGGGVQPRGGGGITYPPGGGA
jgi:hypothetical protein